MSACFEVKDQPPFPATLHTALLTANQAPHGEEWKAVWSRIAFRFTPPEVTTPWGRFQTGQVYLHTHGHAPELPLVDMDQVRELSKQREFLDVPPGVLLVESWISGEFHRRCQEDAHLGRSGLFSSDLRRENLFLDVIRAGAVLEGRARADYSHVRRYLPYALPLGDDADGIAAHAILEDVLDKILPRKMSRDDLAVYDAPGRSGAADFGLPASGQAVAVASSACAFPARLLFSPPAANCSDTWAKCATCAEPCT